MSEMKRVVFEFSPNAFERLKQLKQDTNAENYAEVIREALCVYIWMINCKNSGFDIGSVKDGQLVKTVEFLL